MYFVTTNSLLKIFDSVVIKYVPRLENQEAKSLAQISSGYKVSKEKLYELIEVKEKLVLSSNLPLELPKAKLVGVDVTP